MTEYNSNVKPIYMDHEMWEYWSQYAPDDMTPETFLESMTNNMYRHEICKVWNVDYDYKNSAWDIGEEANAKILHSIESRQASKKRAIKDAQNPPQPRVSFVATSVLRDRARKLEAELFTCRMAIETNEQIEKNQRERERNQRNEKSHLHKEFF